jgi:hypothetical protein
MGRLKIYKKGLKKPYERALEHSFASELGKNSLFFLWDSSMVRFL